VDLLSQTLEPVRVAEFEKHLETCADCQRFPRRRTRPLGGRWTGGRLYLYPLDFRPRLYARIAQEEAGLCGCNGGGEFRARRAVHGLEACGLPWAAACAVLTVGLMVRMPGPSDTSSQLKPEKGGHRASRENARRFGNSDAARADFGQLALDVMKCECLSLPPPWCG